MRWTSEAEPELDRERAAVATSWPCSTSATTSTSTAGPSGCAATWSRSSPRTRRTARSASISSATRSKASRRSTPLRGTVLRRLARAVIFPASHYVTQRTTQERALQTIRAELGQRIDAFRGQGKLLEAQRIEQRTHFDLEMIQELGLLQRDRELLAPPRPAALPGSRRRPCSITSRGFSALHRREPRRPFPSCRACTAATAPARKRWSSTASGSRPRWTTGRCGSKSSRRGSTRSSSSRPPRRTTSWKAGGDAVVEQIIRPTGLVDPVMEVRSARNQVDDLHRRDPQPCRARASGCS